MKLLQNSKNDLKFQYKSNIRNVQEIQWKTKADYTPGSIYLYYGKKEIFFKNWG